MEPAVWAEGQGAAPRRADLRAEFSRLGFDFGASGEDEPLVGFATDGRVGVVEITDNPLMRISLLISSDRSDPRNEYWSAACLATVSAAVRADFVRWLRSELMERGSETDWACQRSSDRFRISAEFHPLDVVLLTVEQTTRQGRRSRPRRSWKP